MPTDAERVEAEVSKRYKGASQVSMNHVASNFLQGTVYYVEFATPAGNDFCYAFADPNGVELYDDGEYVIKAFKEKLDRRRSILQRLNEFSLTEVIGALIALTVTVAFVSLSIAGAQVNTEFLGIFSLIAGYYFGKSAGVVR